MVCRRIALSIVAVTAFLVAPGTLRAQKPTEPKASDPATVAIDDKSIGGTVTSRFGPEAGVWIIAETRDLGTTSSPACQMPATGSGCAAMAWWIPRR